MHTLFNKKLSFRKHYKLIVSGLANLGESISANKRIILNCHHHFKKLILPSFTREVLQFSDAKSHKSYMYFSDLLFIKPEYTNELKI